jgi:predicted house-cleaning noncanonical NTP pyrophosphatase (MazG superfamily)
VILKQPTSGLSFEVSVSEVGGWQDVEVSQGRTVAYRKLVRDRVPEIIAAAGGVATVRVLEPSEFLAALVAKLHEEADELGSAAVDERLSELADVREVLSAVTVALGFSEEEVDAAAARKRAERGGFGRRLWLGEVRAT